MSFYYTYIKGKKILKDKIKVNWVPMPDTVSYRLCHFLVIFLTCDIETSVSITQGFCEDLMTEMTQPV